jgi:glycosyltransferase involved in cell wall biosynthesis
MMLLRLLSASDRSRFESSVLSLMPPGSVGARIERLPVPIHSLDVARGRLSITGFRRLARLARRLAPDLIQGWMYHGNLAGTAAWWRQGRRPWLVWSVHHSLTGLAEEKPLTRWLIALSARLSRLPQAIVYCARASARQHEELGFAPERGLVIPNGIDTELFRPDRAARARLLALTGLPTDRPLVGMVARYHPMKDHANLLRAAGQLREQGIDLQIVLLGRGLDEANEALQGIAQQAGVRDRLSLLGERDDVPELVPGLDVLVSPSAWGEAFPLAVGEAMAGGVPCVVTDVGDCRWLVGDTGAVVPPRDPAALTSAVGALLQAEPAARQDLGARCRARIEENFALPRIVQRYQDLYSSLAEVGNAQPPSISSKLRSGTQARAWACRGSAAGIDDRA